MRIRITVIAVLMCLIATTAMARTDDTGAIQALFYRVARAMSAKDPAGVMALGTSDLTYIDKGKVLSGNQIARHMQARFRLMQGSPRCRFTVLSMQVKGAGASVMTSDITEAEVTGLSGRVHRVTATGRSRNELVKTKRGWLLRSVYVLSSSMMMDGRTAGGSAL